MKYRAFLSYSHSDRQWARWLHRRLESYRPPPSLELPQDTPRRLGPVFRDRDELPSAASLSQAVEEALARSEWLIVICSPAAAQSRWVNEEIRAFRALGRADRILCFVVAGEPGTGDSAECLPPALTGAESPDVAAPEPIAADARPQGDGRSNAMLKIAAGMLGVGFDALRQRAVRRRQRQLVAIAGGSLLIAAVTIVLAISAVMARNEAQERRAQADALIDFMLVDLREQLHKIGRLDVFKSVGDKALEYFAAQRNRDDSPRNLSQRARNLRQIGEVRLQSGDLGAALDAYGEALLISERLAAQDRTNAQAQIDMANSRFYVGHVHWLRGELPEAREAFERVIAVVDEVWARKPDHPDWLIERAYAYTNLGRVLEQQGDFEQALSAYQAVMEANQRLTELEPDDPEWWLELGFAHNNLGKLLYAMGDLDEAESHFRSDLEFKRRVFENDRSHNINKEYFAVARYFLGQLLLYRGAHGEAELLLSQALSQFGDLVRVDPERMDWRVRHASTERELGILKALAGRPEESAQRLRSSADLLGELVERESGNAVWRRNLARTLLVSADFAARQGDASAARLALAPANEHIDRLLAKEPSIIETQALAVYADICRAHLDGGASDPGALRSALQTLDAHFAGSRDPGIIEFRAVALAGLGEPEATDLARTLADMGYRGMQFPAIEEMTDG